MVTSIEAPFALLQKPVEVLLLDAVKTPQVTLGLVPEVLDPVDVIPALREEFGVVDPHVMKITHIKRIVCTESIRVNDTVRLHFLLYDGEQSGGLCIGDNHGVNLPAPFQQAEYSHFTR